MASGSINLSTAHYSPSDLAREICPGGLLATISIGFYIRVFP